MVDKDNNIFKALWRYFTGKREEEGEQIFNRWFDSFDDSKGYIDRLTREESEEHQQKIFKSLKKDLRLADNRPVKHRSVPRLRSRSRTRRWEVLYRAAAILVAGSVLALAGVYLSGVSDPDPEPVAMVQKSNPVGQISSFTLPDGSRVWLSAASTLHYPEEFPESDRILDLDGEAYFEVAKDSGRPFIVNSGPVSTRVLGTSFNIRAYRDDPDIEVSLATGEVEVTAGEEDRIQKQILAPNQQVNYEKESGLSDIRSIDASLSSAWTQQELVFVRETFATIARTFERWYDVEFIFEDEALKEEIFVYHFKELSLQNSMLILNELADFEYELTGQTVIIRNSLRGNEQIER